LILVLAVVVTGCRPSPSSGSPSQAPPAAHCGFLKKTGIVARLGIAYRAFKRYLYNPYKVGKFQSGASGRKVAIVKGVIAELVGLHEAKKAITKASECGTGAKIRAALASIERRMSRLRSGATSASDAQIGSQIKAMSKAYATATGSEGGL
jgi:hypothetical protein